MLKQFYMEFLDKEMYLEQPERLVQDRNKRFVCKLKKSMYALKLERAMVQAVWFLQGEPNFTKSEYNHCVYGMFIILVLYVMLVVSTNMFEINGI